MICTFMYKIQMETPCTRDEPCNRGSLIFAKITAPIMEGGIYG